MKGIEKVGNYSLLEQIGEGGMATIFRANHENLRRDVAVKKMKNPSKETIDRFKQEARISARMNHENIVSIYDFFKEGRTYLLIMEFIDGIDLRNILELDSPLQVYQAVRIVHEIAKGLEYSHFKKIIHRDIKPSNILLSKEGDIKIIDFGVAKIDTKQNLTQTGIIIGTPSYMSPEYANGEELTPQSDVYSLGVLFYEILTGFKPFSARSKNELLVAITRGKYKSPRKFNREISLRLQHVIKKSMHVNPAKRYKTMADFINALDKFLKNEPQSVIKSELQLYYGELMERKRLKKYKTNLSTTEQAALIGRKNKTPKRYFIAAAVALFTLITVVWGYQYLREDYFSRLQMQINIPGAEQVALYLNGDFLGKSENGRFTKSFIPSGESLLLVDGGQNYQLSERRLFFKSGETKFLKMDVKRRSKKATLTVESVPQGANFYLNDKLKGRTPVHNQRLSPGKYEISVKARGYKPYRQSRRFDAAVDIVILIELERK